VHALDVRDPAHPRRAAFVATVDPHGMASRAAACTVADGIGGLKVFDVSQPGKLRPVGQLPTFDARDVHVQWPYAYVADGRAGSPSWSRAHAERAALRVVLRPQPGGRGGRTRPSWSRRCSRTAAPKPRPANRSTSARRRATSRPCSTLEQGLYLVDVTEPARPSILFPSAGFLASDRNSGRPRAARGGTTWPTAGSRCCRRSTWRRPRAARRRASATTPTSWRKH
jgi:hypothetical protein